MLTSAVVKFGGLGQTGLDTILDPSVVKRPDGYYMVFEGAGAGCTWSSRSAYSADGLTNWQYRNTPVCITQPNISGSVPNYFVDVETGVQYLQWANVDRMANIATRNQATISSLWMGTLRFTNANDMLAYILPRSTPNQWDYMNTSAGSVMYEDGYYYMVHDGATSYECKGQWGLGIMRTATPSIRGSWTRSPTSPFMLADKADNCWLQYPNITKIGGSTYLYYYNALPNWVPDPQVNSLTIYRHILIQQ